MEIKYYKKQCETSCDATSKEFLQAVMESHNKKGTIEIIDNLETAILQGMPAVPALVINGELILSGYKPSEKEFSKFIKKAK